MVEMKPQHQLSYYAKLYPDAWSQAQLDKLPHG